MRREIWRGRRWRAGGAGLGALGALAGAAAPAAADAGRVEAEVGAAEVLTVEEAVALALAGNRGLAAAGLEVERAEHGLTAARTDWPGVRQREKVEVVRASERSTF